MYRRGNKRSDAVLIAMQYTTRETFSTRVQATTDRQEPEHTDDGPQTRAHRASNGTGTGTGAGTGTGTGTGCHCIVLVSQAVYNNIVENQGFSAPSVRSDRTRAVFFST